MLELLSHIVTPLLLFGSALLFLLMISFVKRENGRFVNNLSIFVLILSAIIEIYYLYTGRSEYIGHMVTNDSLTSFSMIILFIIGIFTIITISSFRGFMNEDGGESAILVLFAVCGMQIMLLASEMILMLIGLEISSMALFLLSGRNSGSRLSIEGTIKYLIISSVFFAIALMGVVMIYGYMLSLGVTSDMLSFHNLMFVGKGVTAGSLPMLVATLLIISIMLLKLGIIPYHMWVPDFYEGSPSCVSGFASTSIKVASVVVLLNIFSKMFSSPLIGEFHPTFRLLEILTLLTVVISTLIALHQTNAKRLIAYSSISNAGIILLGILAYLSVSIEMRSQVKANIIFYLIVYSIMNLLAFGIFSRLEKSGGGDQKIHSFKGLFYRSPFYAISLSTALFSLAGLPPTGGFFAKLFIFKSALDSNLIFTSIIAILMTIVSLYYYLSFLLVMFVKEPSEEAVQDGSVAFNAIVGLGVIFLILSGTIPGPIIDLLALLK